MQESTIEIEKDKIAKKSIKSIDFNCDLAQSYGVYKNKNEY